MRIVVHDFAGHQFPVDLSRELALRGHDVLHLYCASFLGPRGAMEPLTSDPPGLTVEGLSIGRDFDRYSAKQRLLDELAFGAVATKRISAYDPEAILSTGTAVLSQYALLREAKRAGRRFVYWWQDSYGVGIHSVIRRRSATLAPVVAWPFQAFERHLLQSSDEVVAISEGMRQVALKWGVHPGKVRMISNWPPRLGLPNALPESSWKSRRGLSGAPLALYAGTLGLKHDPEMLVQLALAGQTTGFAVAVISQGPGRRYLEERREALNLENLTLLDYEPPEVLSEVLAAADILVVILESDAGAFSVPSKVFSYLGAGRAILGALPSDNLAAEVLKSAEAGVCVEPGDTAGFCAAALRLLGDPAERERLGANGRRYAAEHFDPARIADRFEQLLRPAQMTRTKD
jgi:glycosyltransferase involved in cell wall biosynthesis